MYKKCFYTMCFVLTAMANFVLAGGIEIREIGAKATSMGGAFRALADDGTSVFWNPAGLTQIKGQNVTAEASFIRIKSKVGQNYYSSSVISGYKTENVEQKKTWELVPTIAYANDLKVKRDKLKFGVGVYTQHGLGTDFDMFSDPVSYPTYPEYDWKSAGNFTSIHPAVAKQVNDRVSVGVGFFATRGTVEKGYPLIFPGALLDGSLTGLNVPVDSRLKGDGWGYGGNIGVLCKVNNEFTCGLSYRSSSAIKFSGETNVSAYAPTLNAISSERSSSSCKLTLPANLGFGLVYRPQENVTISTDVDWTEWSSFDRCVITSDTPGALITSTSTSVDDWRNTVRYSLGLNYKMAHNFNVYTGCYIDPSPIPDKTLTPLVPDCGTKKSFAMSLGWTVKTMEFICGYEYMAASSRTVTGAPQDVNGDGVVDNLPGNYTLKSDVVKLGANILF